jgi:hypothetical protein
MNRALLIAGLAVLAIAAVGGIAYAANHAFATTRTHDSTVAEIVHRVVVDVDAGDVKLVPAGAHVRVRERRHYVGRGPRISQQLRDGVLTIRSDCPSLVMLDCATDLRLGLPAGVGAEVHTDTGDVHAKALRASELSVTTNVGDIALDLARPAALAEARSNVGDVRVAVPPGTYAVQADTDVGERAVRGLVQDDRTSHAITARSDVGDVTVRAR